MTSVEFRWLLDCSQVACGLGDHFATIVAHLSPSCALPVAIVYLILFVPLYIIVMPYLRHYGAFLPSTRVPIVATLLRQFVCQNDVFVCLREVCNKNSCKGIAFFANIQERLNFFCSKIAKYLLNSKKYTNFAP